MITQLLISSSAKPIITASYVIVGGGGGATVGGSNGLGGDVINRQSILLPGTYQIVIGAGGRRSGGTIPAGTLGSSSSFYGFTANGSIRTSTVSVDGQIFSGMDGGAGLSNIAGSGALASGIFAGGSYYCYASSPSASSQAICNNRGGSWTNLQGGHGNNGVVIITIATALISSISTSGASITTNGSNTIYRYDSSGSITI